MVDVNIRTGALREFAGNSQVDIDVDAIRQLPEVAARGKSMMDEGTAFHTAHAAAGEAIVAQFEKVRGGSYGYRDGANQIGDTYVTTEHDVIRTQKSVRPFEPAPTEHPAPPTTPTTLPADPTVLV